MGSSCARIMDFKGPMAAWKMSFMSASCDGESSYVEMLNVLCTVFSIGSGKGSGIRKVEPMVATLIWAQEEILWTYV